MAVNYSKVEICGIDTAKLPVISEKEKLELIKKARQGDKAARDKMITCNLRLVLSVVQKFSNRGENPDDLFQVGCIGLVKAIDNFNENLMVKFSTYGVPMIIGEIRRYLRDNNSIRVSRSMRDTAYKALQIREKLLGEQLIEPTVNEIAEEMGVPRQEVVTALEAIVEPLSLYEPIYSDSGDTLYVMDQVGDPNGEQDWIDEIIFKEAVEDLSEREKKILSLRFMSGKTQMEVSREIGISQAQVSRLEKSALERIKRRI
ncbi:MAG: RNA polymerase sporulation sigma factor SigG [Oscillospiraceae bacterium]|nr:RNA polymerase sporulation sigma factor SigG [Oscillospiraceae bacterium]